MGQTTPNMSIYIPTAGETNYDTSFAAGMMNVDQHDHTGGPFNGVPIPSSGLADDSVTYPKLNANVADNSTGIGTNTGSLSNQLAILGVLKNIYQLGSAGFLVKQTNTINSPMRAAKITGTANQVDVLNQDGTAADPQIRLTNPIYANISFDSGTTTLNAYQTNTFTPNLSFGGASTGITYNFQIGKYYQIGSMIYFSIYIELTSKGISTGNAAISNLPFPSASDGFPQTFATRSYLNVNAYPGTNLSVLGNLSAGSSSIELISFAYGGSTPFVVDDTGFNNTSIVTMSGFYWLI